MVLLLGMFVGATVAFVLAAVHVHGLRRQLQAAERASQRLTEAESDVKTILDAAQTAAARMLEHSRLVLMEADARARDRESQAELFLFESRPTQAPRSLF